MSYPSSFPDAGNPPEPGPPSGPSYPGQAGQPYGAAPTGPGYAAPTGPYGQAGPYGGPPGFGGPPGPPPKKGKGGLIAFLSIGGVLAVVLVVVAGFWVFGGDDIDDLPAPKTLGRDPVPAERHVTARPPHCGISRPTVKALTPGGTLDSVGGTCRWLSSGSGATRSLDVEYEPSRPYIGSSSSRVSNAINQFQASTSEKSALNGGPYKPLTGLGDDAAYRVGPSSTGSGTDAYVVFRTGDLVTRVSYRSIGGPAAQQRFRTGALRAAGEVAKGLGAPANPVDAQVGKAAPVQVPGDVCKLVPEDLFQTLGDDADPLIRSAGTDLVVVKDNIGSATTSGCRSVATSSSRHFSTRVAQVFVTAPTEPGKEAEVNREYLRTYYKARAERATSGGGARYFQALSGLGDQAFCSYLEGRRSLTLGKNKAVVVVRSRTALITVMFGAEAGDTGLTQDQTVNGAYAVAVKVAAGVK